MHNDCEPGNRAFIAAVVCVLVIIIMLFSVRVSPGRDLGQWENSDPATKQWYEHLMQPDAPMSPCCGEADAYWADEIHVRDGKTYATITDDRDDGPLKRPHIPNGTEIEIPNNKLKWDSGNPTGHNVLFMSYRGWVYCFVQGSGT